MSWVREDFIAKALLFANYAEELNTDDPRYPLWMALCLEMLARAALSQVNPCLLADIRPNGDETASNLFYACGIRTTDKTPISVGTSTVLKRCRVLITNFTDAEVRWCTDFASKRNEELHSGASPYSTFTTEKWLTDYFRIVTLITDFLQIGLAEIFGASTAAMASSLISDQAAHIKKQTVDLIQSAKQILFGLTEEEINNRASKTPPAGVNGRRVKCPTGEHECIVSGEINHASSPRLDDDGDIVIVMTIIPTNLTCYVCGLRLTTHAALVEAGVGAPLQKLSVQDPIEFHGIEIMEHVSDDDMHEYMKNQFEPDYGND